mmetsp:Transcript_41322/g.83413  ORF Transcript_41322/g.83413 Transcript_41322/m.83413 type:complete len:342 (-) Transcript_41322:293-1318(-)
MISERRGISLPQRMMTQGLLLILGLPGNHGFHQGRANPTTSLIPTSINTNIKRMPAFTRRSLLGGMIFGVGALARAPSVVAAVGSGGEGDAAAATDSAMVMAAQQRKLLKEELFSRLASPEGSKDEASLDALVNQLSAVNPTINPGLQASFESVAASGSWRVAYAPHIRRISNVFRTTFDPIRYVLDTSDGTVVSNVGYDSKLIFNFKGWLSASGTFGSIDATDSRIRFDKFWWTVLSGVGKGPEGGRGGGASARSEVIEGGAAGQLAMITPLVGGPGGEAGVGPSDPLAVFPGLIQTVGSAGFVEQIGRFPVFYLDEDTCVFSFPPLNVKILARKEKSRN